MGGELNMSGKYLLIAFFLLLIACSSDTTSNSPNSYAAHPQMDKRVVAYVGGGNSEGNLRIATDMDELKEWFPKALNEEHFDSKCNYFSITVFAPGGLEYFVVSKETTDDSLLVYRVLPPGFFPSDFPDLATCVSTDKPETYSFLICDKEGGLKDRVKPSIVGYLDHTWDCSVENNRQRDYFEFKAPEP